MRRRRVPRYAMPRELGAKTIRVAAAADIHCSEENAEKTARAFADIDAGAELIILAGDLTTHGEPQQASVLADACGGLETPVIAVLGNHDWHVDRRDELVAVLTAAGIKVLDRGSCSLSVGDLEVGVVGIKGFVGGFPGSYLSDFGEPLLRAVYAETSAEVAALDAGLSAISGCSIRIAVLHYAPTIDTLAGEPEPIWAFLGTDRLAPPLVEHAPDLVVHGHAHAGRFRGRVGDVPVFNVSVPVMGRDFWVFELAGQAAD